MFGCCSLLVDRCSLVVGYGLSFVVCLCSILSCCVVWFVVRYFVILFVVSCLLFVVCRLMFGAKRLLFEALYFSSAVLVFVVCWLFVVGCCTYACCLFVGWLACVVCVCCRLSCGRCCLFVCR